MLRRRRRLPKSADWVIEGEIAALSLPTMDDLRQLKAAGFGLVVNLTEDPHPTTMAAAAGLKGAHLPVPDFGEPTLEQMADFVATVERYLADGLPVAVHCLGGRGRTGTMIAAYLVKQGMGPWEAIERVRKMRKGAVETPEQERAVVEWSRYLRGSRPLWYGRPR